jgi:hypothetical protein
MNEPILFLLFFFTVVRFEGKGDEIEIVVCHSFLSLRNEWGRGALVFFFVVVVVVVAADERDQISIDI